MLVYDITNEKSFENIRTWIRNIEEVSSGCIGYSWTDICQISCITHRVVLELSCDMSKIKIL